MVLFLGANGASQKMKGFKNLLGIERRGHTGNGSEDESRQLLGLKEKLPNF